jgi:hypothetical protein
MIIPLGQSLLPITDDAAQNFINRFVAVMVAAVIACAGLACSTPRRNRAAGPRLHRPRLRSVTLA